VVQKLIAAMPVGGVGRRSSGQIYDIQCRWYMENSGWVILFAESSLLDLISNAKNVKYTTRCVPSPLIKR